MASHDRISLNSLGLRVSIGATLVIVSGLAFASGAAAANGPTAQGKAKATAITAGPQLSIGVGDGRTSAKPGDRSTYTITVRNLGLAPVKRLVITEILPPGLVLQSMAPAGVDRVHTISWSLVDLKAEGSSILRTSTSVIDTPDSLLRLATVVCASTSVRSPAIVCASDSDLLPAGAKVATQTAELAAAKRPSSGSSDSRELAAGIAIIVGIAGATSVALVHRRKSRTT